MEKSNVNNLNGVPNFGHGDDKEVVVPTPVEASSVDEETEEPETEDKPKRKKTK